MEIRSLFRRLALAGGLVALLLFAAYQVRLDGVAHGGAWRMWGRLHPLLVHLPLALLLLVPVLEVCGRRRPPLKEAAGFVLGLALVGAIASVFAGLALARTDGHDGTLVMRHLWGGVGVATGAALAWAVRGHGKGVYPVVLIATLGTLAWASHQGGTLTHGADYLIEPLPQLVKQTLHLHETPGPETFSPETVFGAAIHPVLEKHCFACHGAEKQKGEYRMDLFATLLAGGKSGKPAVVPGRLAQSEMVRRLNLELDDEKVMPPRKKPRPTVAEITVLRWWIKQGASRDLALAAVREAPPEVMAALAAGKAETSESAEPVYVARVGDYSSLRGEIDRVQRELGIKLVPVSRHAGDGLILWTREVAAHFGDEQLSQLAKVAPFIVEAELGDTRVTDAALASLAAFSHLERLHVEGTAITGATLRELKTLSKLNYLNLCKTSVTDDNLQALQGLKSLKQVYVFGSQVTGKGVDKLRSGLPECVIGPVAAPILPAPPPIGLSSTD